MKKHSYLLIIFLCLGGFHSIAQKNKNLKFNNNGEFKIAQFTDIHWDENADNSTETVAIIKNVIKTEKPDFIILTGDIVCYKPAREGWMSIAKTFSEAKISWGVLMGNHDPELDMTRQEIYDFLKKQPYYIGDIGPKEIHGTGNFLVSIQSSKKDKIAATLYCLDSNDYAKNELKHGHYDWIHFDQIQWYRNNSQKLSKANGGKPLPSLAYFHIPLPEYNELIKSNEFYGEKREKGASSPKINSGFFSSILEMEDIMGTFVGHDHDNSFIGIKNDIALGYGRVSGLNAYGTLERGARIVMMYEGKFQFDTWIRTNKGASELFYYPSRITKEEEEKSTYHEATSLKSPKQGVTYKYYEYEGKIKSVDQLKDTSISKFIKQGTLKNFSLKPMQRNDFFGIEYNTWIKIPKDAIYKFYAYSDDGSKVFIDDTLVVDNDGSHSTQRADGKIALKAGYHKMKVLYFESYMSENIEIGISARENTEMPIPNDMLYIAE
jgi:hypothetical protein